MENQKPSNSSDELDLGQLFSKIGEFFKNIGFSFIRLLALIRRVPLENKLVFGLIISACVVMGVAYAKLLSRKYYESTMILSSEYLNKRLVDNTITKLNMLAGEKNKRGLARTFNVSDTLADNILGFTAKPFVAEKDLIELEVLKEQLKNAQANAKNDQVISLVLKRIEIENRHAFEITVRTLNPTVINNLQTALVNYFRNNTYIKRRIEINKENLREKQQKITGDLHKLDSLKTVIYDNYRNMASQRDKGSNNLYLGDKAVTDPIEIYKQDANLYDELQEINKKLYLQPDFEVVDGFTEFSEPSSASILKIVVASLLIGIAFGYALVAAASFNQYLANFSK